MPVLEPVTRTGRFRFTRWRAIAAIVALGLVVCGLITIAHFVRSRTAAGRPLFTGRFSTKAAVHAVLGGNTFEWVPNPPEKSEINRSLADSVDGATPFKAKVLLSHAYTEAGVRKPLVPGNLESSRQP
jgi:hypothetical protein